MCYDKSEVIELKITEKEWNIKEILNVRRGRTRPQRVECENRYSDCFVYVLTGQAEYFFGDRCCLAEPGNVIYLARGSQYSILVTDENYTYIYFDFLFDGIPEPMENEIYKEKNIAGLENEFHRLHRLWAVADYADKLYCKSLVYKVYSEIAKANLSRYVSKDRKRQMEDAAKYMEDNLADSNLSVADLSQRYRISQVHFRRTFYHVYHTTPIGFLTSLRIKRAKEMLSGESCSIAEISEKCGFQNHYYFSKVFKSVTAQTPSEYRKNNAKLL